MKNRIANPYLPLDEYIPDGEPRVFGDRLYVYGSHDRAGGHNFCLEDYVVWSAPLEDLSDWHYEGVSYRKDQDPHNLTGECELFAPDVVQGPDGRFYLFYCLRMVMEFGVAVSDSPAGPFAFYGHISYEDGAVVRENMPYDPSVLVDDDGRIYLYYGFAAPDFLAEKFRVQPSDGCYVLELAQDMKTAITRPIRCLPRDTGAHGSTFEGHAYYEAPSMRKIQGKYYLVYSSQVCHELCYAVSACPTRGFVYGGVIVDNGDLGFAGRQYPVALPGNNHGGLVEMGGQLYIFYHRHTQGFQFSRQGCAERVTVLPDGTIPQVEITSQGLSPEPLEGQGTWSAAYACHLHTADGEQMLRYRFYDRDQGPSIWEQDGVQFIRNITHGVTIGYKYFRFRNLQSISLCIRGCWEGTVILKTDQDAWEHPLTENTSRWKRVFLPVALEGIHPLYLEFRGKGKLDLKEMMMD